MWIPSLLFVFRRPRNLLCADLCTGKREEGECGPAPRPERTCIADWFSFEWRNAPGRFTNRSLKAPTTVRVASEPQMKCRTGTMARSINRTPTLLWPAADLGPALRAVMLLLLFFVLGTGVLAKTYFCYNNKTWRARALLYTGLYWYRGAPTTMSVDNQQPIC